MGCRPVGPLSWAIVPRPLSGRGARPPRLGLVLHTGQVEERASYPRRRPVAVPQRLAELAGPTHGRIELPLTLAWTGRRTYDLDSPADLGVLYERIIVEATDSSELEALLNEALLTRIWHQLYLPPQTRGRWESRFPELTQAG